ncbi:MAG: type III-B CRISPR module-associated Cmr3 family protein [Bryobacteraceae bacterium]|jgi:CRISPR-associated protein Cmr3
MHYLFLEPVDVLFFRANKSFGDPGSYGESLVPPWPSVAAGALRSRILVDSGLDLARFAHALDPHPELGTPYEPGTFRLCALQLALRRTDGAVEPLYPMPADLSAERDGERIVIRQSRPVALPAALRSSYPLPLHPVLPQPVRGKPLSGAWLTPVGWKKYLRGEAPQTGDIVFSSSLWKPDPRVGIGLDAWSRSVSEGRLFTAEAVAFRQLVHGGNFDAGFFVAVDGATPPQDGMVRLGADGRAAAVHFLKNFSLPEPDYEAIARAGACRLILATPGIFSRGWLPEGVKEQNGEFLFDLHGVRGRIAAAAVPRAAAVSGWDLAQEKPKAARRAAPAGSVWWLDRLEAAAGSLRTLVSSGLWPEPCPDAHRRAEGFNRIWIAPWPGANKGA